MMDRQAKADVTPIRQRTQYSCMAASLCMCLNAHGHTCNEDEVNSVMRAKPMRGASWEDALAAAQHYGMRATLTVPCTIPQLKQWTDEGIPIMIAWNPEGRPWSHASVVYDIDDEYVYVADPNIPDPEETVRIVPHKEFYGKWFEKAENYLIRRPALAIEREITLDGKQMKMATKKNLKIEIPKSTPRNPIVEESAKRNWGSGYHKNKERDYELGHGRKTKYPRDYHEASYEGNPDGEGIYPVDIDHGYDEPVSGGTNVIQQLQKDLLREQGAKIAQLWLQKHA